MRWRGKGWDGIGLGSRDALTFRIFVVVMSVNSRLAPAAAAAGVRGLRFASGGRVREREAAGPPHQPRGLALWRIFGK